MSRELGVQTGQTRANPFSLQTGISRHRRGLLRYSSSYSSSSRFPPVRERENLTKLRGVDKIRETSFRTLISSFRLPPESTIWHHSSSYSSSSRFPPVRERENLTKLRGVDKIRETSFRTLISSFRLPPEPTIWHRESSFVVRGYLDSGFHRNDGEFDHTA